MIVLDYRFCQHSMLMNRYSKEQSRESEHVLQLYKSAKIIIKYDFDKSLIYFVKKSIETIEFIFSSSTFFDCFLTFDRTTITTIEKKTSICSILL